MSVNFKVHQKKGLSANLRKSTRKDANVQFLHLPSCQKAAQHLPKGSRKMPLHFLHFNGVVCTNTLEHF